MTTDISHLGCSDFRVLYQGRINGEESAARIRTHKWERNLSEDPDVSRQQEGTNTSSFTSSTFIVNASNLLPCLLVCFKLQKEIQSIGLRKSSPPDWKSWSVIGGRPPTSGSKGFLVKYTEVFPRTGNLIRYSAQILAIS
jgi:hypothetical protein